MKKGTLMSLRKSPTLTSRARAANRRNALQSTGPRTAAGKERARHNALQPGRNAKNNIPRDTMLALGEDPQEFENLYQSLLRAYGPADPLWAKQVEDLTKLYWRRGRLEHARDALLRQQMEQPQLEQQRRLEEIERSTFPPTEDRMIDVTEPAIEDPVARLRLSLSYLQLIRQQAARGYFVERQRFLLKWLFEEAESWRRCRIDDLLWQHLPPCGVLPKDPVEENGHSRLLELLDEEIAEVRKTFDKALQESQEVSPAARAALLAPMSDRWEMLNRQENDLQRAIDRKTRILLAHLRLRRVQSNRGNAERSALNARGEQVRATSRRREVEVRDH
jgi:hypothetical protein